MTTGVSNHAALIWSVAELLRGHYKQSEYGKVVLPLTVIRRLDCVLEPSKTEVLTKAKELEGRGIKNPDPVLASVAGEQFFNTSPLTFTKLLDDPPHIADNLRAYIAGFSESARDVIERFGFDPHITRLNKDNLLYKVIGKFTDVDLHPNVVSNVQMGTLYERLIRQFSELSNETAGEHFTPREVIRLMVNLLFAADDNVLTTAGVVKTLYDPACGTGGMLSVAEDYLRELNPAARLEVFGQELNDETYAICRSDMMLKGQDTSHIIVGNSFTEDGHASRKFDYMLANPPFGVDWGKYDQPILKENETLGLDGRFGAGIPRKSDGSMLFLQHMISKMKDPEDGGSRIGIVFNASPLFTGSAGGGESEIRRWIIEHDWLEAIVAMPEQMFYNTGIATYVWIITNRKDPERAGMIQLIDGRELWTAMRKSLGDKRREFSDDQIAEITRLYGEFKEGDKVKILPNHYFGFQRITVERPLRRVWTVTDEQIEQIKSHRVYTGLGKVKKGEAPDVGETRQQAVIDAFGDTSWRSEPFVVFDDMWNQYRYNLEQRGVKPSTTIRKMLYDVLGVHDPDADPIRDRKGRYEPDTDLRDNENVALPPVDVVFEPDPSDRLESDPYRRAVDEYMTAEVLPWVPDAWVDHSKTKLQPSPTEKTDVLVPYLKAGLVSWQHHETIDLPEMWASPSDVLAYEIRPGDVLVCEGGEVGRSAIVTEVPSSTIIQNSLHRVRSQVLDHRFLNYALIAIAGSGWLDVVTNRATIAHLTVEKLGGLRIPHTDQEQQRCIADFLDRETARIDALVDKKRRLIDLLEEKRTALITQAVTKGLDPTAEMKDSEVPWCERVPAHWQRWPLKELFRFRKGIDSQRLTHDFITGHPGPYPVYSGQTGEGGQMGSINTHDFDTPNGSILVTTVGAKAMTPSLLNGRFSLSQNCALLVPTRSVVVPFIRYQLEPLFKHEWEGIPRGMQPSLRIEDLKKYWVALPDLREQKAIADFINAFEATADELALRLARQIAILIEYRQALITNAVTGELDIPTFDHDEALAEATS